MRSILVALLLIFSLSLAKDVSSIIGEIVKYDEDFVNHHSKSYFEQFKNKQKPYITLVSCSDARVHTNIIEKDPINKIFAIRNIGNQLLTSFGSVDYGVLHLHTPVLLILGHSHCGAIKAALEDYIKEPFDIIKELDHLFIPLSKLKGKNMDFETKWIKGVQANVDYQVELALKKYKTLVEEGKLTIIGAIDDFVGLYKSGEGRIIIVNVNGETNPEKLKKLSIFNKLPKEEKDLIIKRIN
ncbi:MAG: hypothetical protein DSY47_04345 [Hydrogenothermus sp.]|nr:MAG: hypothetical protein DSY47_04345 [Hydrogenothermus sp.]